MYIRTLGYKCTQICSENQTHGLSHDHSDELHDTHMTEECDSICFQGTLRQFPIKVDGCICNFNLELAVFVCCSPSESL